MIICLIGIGIIAILWLIFLYNYICDKLKDKYYELSSKYCIEDEEKSKLYYKKYESWRHASFWFADDSRSCAIIISIILALIFGVIFAGTKGQVCQDYKKALDTKTQIQYVLENDIVVNEDKDSLIVEAIKVNNQIRYYKRVQNNPWINWFGNNDFANMEEINLDSFEK